MSLFEPDARQSLEGSILRFYFRNAATGQAAALLELPSGERVAVRGPIGSLREGQPVKLDGGYYEDPRFGRQFRVVEVEVQRPEGANAVKHYLGSGLVKGIGPALAARIVTHFGADALRIIEEEPRRLREVPGIGAKKSKVITEALADQADLREVLLFLHGLGLSPGLAKRIQELYGQDAPRKIRNNPYRLADELIGVGFKRADEIAAGLGIEPDSPERLEAALLHAASRAVAQEGHCCLPRADLCAAAGALAGQPPEALEAPLATLLEKGRLVAEVLPELPVLDEGVERVYPLRLHENERELAELLWAQAQGGLAAGPRDAERTLAAWERRSRTELPAGQREALVLALSRPLTVITGGPGVGKTTVIRALGEILRMAGRRIELAAPTGRAAKRLSEATGLPAATLHRLLDFQPRGQLFGRNEHRPLECDWVVVDEVSMLDLPLAVHLLRAVPEGAGLVLVGDADQLPPVGPGKVLGDVLASGVAAVARLDEVFRQAAGSGIVANAHLILHGEMPEAPDGVSGGADEARGDFFVVEAQDPERALGMLGELVATRIPQRFGLDPMHDVQVLCPMYRGRLGVDRINETLGDRLNPGGRALHRGGQRFRVGDRVMQVKNDYDRELFNGDPGILRALDFTKGRALIEFGGRRHDFGFQELDRVVPAYGITVHRAQGSEYPAVVLVLDKGHFVLLNRRLVYTAVTRAKQCLVVLGSRWALARAVGNDEDSARYTGLRERLAARQRGDGVHPERWVEPGAGGN